MTWAFVPQQSGANWIYVAQEGTSSSPTVWRPASDITATGWTPSTGASNAAVLDEAVADDGDYTESPQVGTGGPLVMALDSPLPAGANDITFRAMRTGVIGQMRVVLLDASLASVGATAWQTLGGAYADYTLSVTTSATATNIRLEQQQ